MRYIVFDVETPNHLNNRTISDLMGSGILVAHNAVFDLGVLKKCLRDYEVEWKTAEIKKKAVTLIRKEPESEPAIWISLF